MANLWRMESDDPTVGGVLVEWPSGVRKVASWRSEAPIEPTLEAAKEYTAKLVQTMIDERHMDDVERTNIASMVAAIQKHLIDWNDALRVKLYANATPIQ